MRKKKLDKFETVNLSEECSAVLQRKLHLKLKDLDSFNIQCVIGGQIITKVLYDMGANINLMPSSIFNRLGLSEIKPTSIALPMANRSVTHPGGIVEDVLGKVEIYIPNSLCCFRNAKGQ